MMLIPGGVKTFYIIVWGNLRRGIIEMRRISYQPYIHKKKEPTSSVSPFPNESGKMFYQVEHLSRPSNLTVLRHCKFPYSIIGYENNGSASTMDIIVDGTSHSSITLNHSSSSSSSQSNGSTARCPAIIPNLPISVHSVVPTLSLTNVAYAFPNFPVSSLTSLSCSATNATNNFSSSWSKPIILS